MSTDRLPEQETLRRRLRAARALHDLTLEALAERIPRMEKLGARTLRRLENGEAEITPRQIHPIAEALGMPDLWFLTEGNVWAAFEIKASPEFQAQLRALEARMREIEERLPDESEVELSGKAPPAAAASGDQAHVKPRTRRASRPRSGR